MSPLAAHQAQMYPSLQQAYDDLRQTQQTVTQQERLRALGKWRAVSLTTLTSLIAGRLYTESLLEVSRASARGPANT